MENNLYRDFTRLREKRDSIIVLGLDPKDSMQYGIVQDLSEINEGIVGVKPNSKFYHGEGFRDRGVYISPSGLLNQIGGNARKLDNIAILDTKLSDGANTNEAEIRHFATKFPYMTIAPAAGCIEETIDVARKHNVGTISMGVMSFPGVLREIDEGYALFLGRAKRAISAGTQAFVMGATAYVPEGEIETEIQKYRGMKSGAIIDSEMSDQELGDAIISRNDLFQEILELTKDREIVYLVPGFGRQGGNLGHFLKSGIDLNRCMINAGSDILKAENPEEALAEMNRRFNEARNSQYEIEN